MKHVAIEPRVVELVRLELRCCASVGRHRAVAGRRERDDDAGTTLGRPDDLDAAARQLGGNEPAGGVVAPLADESRARAELTRPSRDVRGLPAGAGPRDGRLVVARDEGLVELHDHVEQQVAERRDPHD